MADSGDLVWRTGRPRLCRKKGAIVALSTAPPPDSVVVCLDEMGPESAKSIPGRCLLAATPPGARAKQEAD